MKFKPAIPILSPQSTTQMIQHIEAVLFDLPGTTDALQILTDSVDLLPKIISTH